MTQEEIRIAENYIKERYPVQHSAIQRLMYRLKREYSGLWETRINYDNDECVIIVTDSFRAEVRTRVSRDGSYTVTVCDNWYYSGITVQRESEAIQIMRLELEHMRHAMPNLYKKEN